MKIKSLIVSKETLNKSQRCIANVCDELKKIVSNTNVTMVEQHNFQRILKGVIPVTGFIFDKTKETKFLSFLIYERAMADKSLDIDGDVSSVCEIIKDMLLKKNKAYGDSSLNPVKLFSKVDTIEQINVRIDDKISRLVRGRDSDKAPEDTILDLIGYLILKLVACKFNRKRK